MSNVFQQQTTDANSFLTYRFNIFQQCFGTDTVGLETVIASGR